MAKASSGGSGSPTPVSTPIASTYKLFYSPTLNQAYTSDQMLALFGIPTATWSLESVNSLGFYPVNEVAPDFDNYLYVATPSYTVVGQYADQSWTYTPRPLDQAKANGSWQAKQAANASVNMAACDCGFSNELLTAVSSQDPLDRPARYQDELDVMTAISNQLDSDLTAIDAATTVDEINNIVNKPTGLLFTGRGSGLGPEDLNVSYYNAFNSISMTEAETEIYIPGTATVISYGSGGPGQFDSMGNCFALGDYIMQIRETATSMVIAEFECPLAPAGEDVAF